MGVLGTIARRSYRAVIGTLSFQQNRQCPMCGWQGFQFLPVKPGPLFRFDAMCPECDSAERHRLAYVQLKHRLPKDLGKALHFAPEPCIRRWLEPVSDEYHTADLSQPGVMHNVDIAHLPFEDESFDFIWCSHVLEHVPKDLRAMSELSRVLRSTGIAIIQVPLWGRVTQEDALPSAQERVRKYFEADHVRRYGLDIVDRLLAAGFDVEVLPLASIDLGDVLRYGLSDLAGGEIFFCTKTQARGN